MANLTPVDHDPFATGAAPSQGGGYNLTPVDDDPFAPASGAPKSSLPMFAQSKADQFEDVAKSGGVGLAKGASGLAGIVGSAGQLVDWAKHNAAWAGVKGLEKVG